MTRLVICALTILLLLAGKLSAADVQVTGGTTSIFLDPLVLDPLGLSISRTTGEVLVPGSLPDSVAFPINPRDAANPAMPTTFTYDSNDFSNTFAGTLEHSGSIFFMDGGGDETETGNFTIGFDAGRIDDDTSGFFVRSNVGLIGTLFDLETASVLDARSDGLTAESRLLVSPELAVVLGDNSLAGITIGTARIEAVPEPSAVCLFLGGLVALAANRRRQRHPIDSAAIRMR